MKFSPARPFPGLAFVTSRAVLVSRRDSPHSGFKPNYFEINKKSPVNRLGFFYLVRTVGLEPTRDFSHSDLNAACLPISARPPNSISYRRHPLVRQNLVLQELSPVHQHHLVASLLVLQDCPIHLLLFLVKLKCYQVPS